MWAGAILALALPVSVGLAEPAGQRPLGVQGAQPVTFSADIAPILYSRCATCHRSGGPAPFSLLTYDDARRRAAQLAVVTAARLMPPWQPEPGHGEFAGSRRLTEAEIQLFQEWARQGAAQGDPSTLPPTPQWRTDWALGKPDLVLTMPAYALRADGPDMFRNFVIPAGFSGKRYIRAWEFRPGNPRVVHHATIQVDSTGTARRFDERDPQAGYEGAVPLTARAPDGFFLDWAPGHSPARAVEGTAWPFMGSSDLVLMVHMRPSGKPESVQPSLGLYFTDTPPTRLPVILRLTRQDLDIPAGESRHFVSASYTVPRDVEVHTVQPHAHYLAQEMKADAELPDGRVVRLIYIRRWNFDWQDVFHYRRPIDLPAGTRVKMEYVYDNSSGNVRNPNSPPKRVTYGQQTTDEMAELIFQVVSRNERERPELVKDLHGKVLLEEIKGRRVMLERDPDNAVLRDDLVLMLTEVGDLPGAAEEAARSLALQPASAAAHYNAGAALLALGKPHESRRYFELALRIDPDHSMALYSLALLMDERERIQAIAYLRRALRARPAWPAAQAALAWHLVNGPADPGARAEGLDLAQRAVEATGGRELPILDVLATAQAASSQFAKAAETIRRALALLPAGADDQQARSLRARLAEFEGKIPRRQGF